MKKSDLAFKKLKNKNFGDIINDIFALSQL